MKQYSGLDAQQDLIDFLILNDATCLPEHARNWVRDAVAQGDALTMLIKTMETLYAHRAHCTEGHQLCCDLASFVSRCNFWGLGGLTGRATQICGIMMRVCDGGAVTEEGDLPACPQMAPPEPVPAANDPAPPEPTTTADSGTTTDTTTTA